MAKKNARGRGKLSIYRGKKHRYQGLVTDAGKKAMEAGRAALGRANQMPASSVSDGDLFEFLALNLHPDWLKT